ncbi:isocitrate/isopropylmalate family dehydrogenase [Streptomyces sp. VRA16 Mangrove soil]|uniref:isocitrate/isopropylmalate family dehydrogenase n=1 Tax=Streptomyces sp. VRA16 Mangrove soil TaxID=2817434 RepID=UPI001A9CBA20|nr:isocitrate/isopropylmalate family dehydrogenase [Streptomyces sp. VRA16 Mangrove soil]MBO1337175.1 isocitrate/isopropylmalate dehydrogenase family protein [Streptomyces sp. VRA16 Mangrove soil]
MNRKTVAVLPGDGIGPEVIDAALPVLDALGVPVDVEFGRIGWECWRTEGTPVPDRTWEQIDRSDAVLLGATTTKPHRDALAELAPELRDTARPYVSPIVQLRTRLDLFANLRPVENYLGGAPYRFCVVRENTEGLYCGLDYRTVPDALWPLAAGHPGARRSGPQGTAASVRLQTRHGLDRILRFAFAHARAHGHPRVTLADKPNVLRESSAFVRERLEAIGAEYPGIPYEILNVDAVALWLTRRPERFGVIVAENMFGDILSDLGAGVMGGLGLAPSANIGESGGYFEPVHGSAPALAGTGRANPAAAFLTVGLLLDHLGFSAEAAAVQDAVRRVVRRRDRVTYDLGGTATTGEAAAAVLEACGTAPHTPTGAVVTVGDELLRGDLEDSNAGNASRMLGARGVPVRARQTVGDDEATIADAVRPSLGRDDVVVLMGGLGPTSDDVTRSGLARALGRPLEHREEAWQGVVARLERFGVSVHEDNRRQALFPEGATLLPNANGTAWGCLAEARGTTVVMLPGPPRECLPMLEEALRDRLGHLPRPAEHRTVFRRTLGIIEADAAALVDAVVQETGLRLKPSYRWHYPYVDLRVDCPPADADEIAKRLDAVLGAYVVTDRDRTAVQELAELCDAQGLDLDLDDRVTGGRFARELAAARESAAGGRTLRARLTGTAHGATSATPHTGTLTLVCSVQQRVQVDIGELTIPHRGPEVSDYATQFAAWSLARHLTKEHAR